MTTRILPLRVNFSAFLTKLIRICFSLMTSPINIYGSTILGSFAKRLFLIVGISWKSFAVTASYVTKVRYISAWGLNMATINSKTSFTGLNFSTLGSNFCDWIILISRTSFTRHRSKFSWETTRLIKLIASSPSGNYIKFSKNISDVPRGVRNSCDIVDV